MNKNDAEISALKEKEVNFKFDLINGPCFRVKALMLGQELNHIIFNIHHIVCDGWSLSVILREWSEIYNNLVKKEKIEETNSTQIFDYAKIVPPKGFAPLTTWFLAKHDFQLG